MYPRLFHIYGPLWIHTYGVMIALGFLVFLFLTLRHPLRKKLMRSEDYLNTLFIGLVGGIVGGRLLFVILNPEEFENNWIEIFYPWVGGFVVLGSILAVLVVIPIYLYYKQVPILPLLDLAALYTPLMQAIGRVGCLCAGCCYGAPAHTFFWAITFSNPQGMAPLHVPLHPAQIYTSLTSLAIFFILQVGAQYFLTKPGTIVCCFLLLENTSRFVLDFWRGDRQPIVTSLFNQTILISQTQCFSAIGLFISGMGLLWLLKKK